jgi:STE24 endopeptidase
VIEKKYGFTTTTTRTYVFDKLKSWILTILLFGGFYSLLYWLYSIFGSDFWWLAWLVVSCVSIFFAFFYSTLIVPLFNKQTPLGPGDLRQLLEQLAVESGFTIDNIYVIDGSKRSTRANAYFSGFGAKRRIVLYDTLIDKFDNEEIAAVLAHEIGHYRKKHIVFSMILSVLSTGIMFWLFSQVIGRPEIYAAMGIEGKPFYIGIILFGLLYTPVSLMLSLGSNYISRRFEFQADAFASSHHYANNLKEALKKLAADDLSDLTPHPAYVFVHYSHPPLAERLNRLSKSSVN